MMDTDIKDGRSAFEFLAEFELQSFVIKARALELKTAIADTIKFEDIPVLKRIRPDIITAKAVYRSKGLCIWMRQEFNHQKGARRAVET